jgi:hypothetical protein
MKIAIVGSRNFRDYDVLKKFVLSKISVEDISLVVSGGATGADSLGEKFAQEYRIATKIFIPDWNKYGKSAGFKRNIQIVEEADLVFAFWDGRSVGTKHSIDIAKDRRKDLWICYSR